MHPAGWEPEGIVRLRWEPPLWTRTPAGWVQGGFLAVVLDMAQSFAVVTVSPDGHGAVTLDMGVTFLESPMAESYIVEARTVRAGRTIAHTEGTITDSQGRLVATGRQTNLVRAFRRPEPDEGGS
ncbi:MAG TPA: PaaI family thioesterase [Actinomycetota bacterium]|nr:PaaI family thioesterase [Actinomycetota bacterium]